MIDSAAQLTAWHRHKLQDMVRFLALEAADQLALCPPFLDVPRLARDEFNDNLAHSADYERANNDRVVSDEQLAGLRAMLDLLQQAYDRPKKIDGWKDYLSNDADWLHIRRVARDFLAHHGWEGPIDPRLYQYFDAQSGRMVTPQLPPR